MEDNSLYNLLFSVDDFLNDPESYCKKFQKQLLSAASENALTQAANENYINCTIKEKIALLYVTSYLVKYFSKYIQENPQNCSEQEKLFSNNESRMEILLKNLLKTQDNALNQTKKISLNVLVGTTYDSINDFFTASQYYEQALQCNATTKAGETDVVQACFVKLCQCYYNHGKAENNSPELAIDLFNKAIITAQNYLNTSASYKKNVVYYLIMQSNYCLANLVTPHLPHVLYALSSGIEGLQMNTNSPDQKNRFLQCIIHLLTFLNNQVNNYPRTLTPGDINIIQSAIDRLKPHFPHNPAHNSNVLTDSYTSLINDLQNICSTLTVSIGMKNTSEGQVNKY
jgi:hypothetical protein